MFLLLVIAVVHQIIIFFLVIEIKHVLVRCPRLLVVVHQRFRDVLCVLDTGLVRVEVASGVRHVVEVNYVTVWLRMTDLDTHSATCSLDVQSCTL